MATRNLFPWPLGPHLGALGLRFVFDVSLPPPVDFGPFSGIFPGYFLTSLTSLAHSGGLAIRIHSIETRNRFP
jgi:hypothetical protein